MKQIKTSHSYIEVDLGTCIPTNSAELIYKGGDLYAITQYILYAYL